MHPPGPAAFRDAQAPTSDDEPVHGLGDRTTRDVWHCLLLGHLPPAPARGRLVLVEGRWHTGTGLARDACGRLVRVHCTDVAVVPLDDPVLWGGAHGGDRSLVVGTR